MKRIVLLRVRIIISTVSVIAGILALVIIFLNGLLFYREVKDTESFLKSMAHNEGYAKASSPMRLHRLFRKFPRLIDATSVLRAQTGEGAEDEDNAHFPIRLEVMGFRNAFAVRLSKNDQIVDVIHTRPLAYTDDEIRETVEKILSRHDKKGMVMGMLYYIESLADGERMLCIANMQGDIKVSHMLIIYSAVGYLISLVLAFLFAYFFSGFIVRPIKEAFQKQKEFISDAGHELKTPIAVIGANVDLLLADHADNKWLQYIKVENHRMGLLVKDLLYLARSDADRAPFKLCPFDLSTAVSNSVLPFESLVFEQGKKMELDVTPGITCTGSEQQIKQVAMILVDNAIKNSEAGDLIRVSVFPDGKKILLKVYNTGQGIKKEDCERIFERFFRTDESRNRETGGYGLGLSIARTIVHAHDGTISVASKYGSWAEFTVAFPRA